MIIESLTGGADIEVLNVDFFSNHKLFNNSGLYSAGSISGGGVGIETGHRSEVLDRYDLVYSTFTDGVSDGIDIRKNYFHRFSTPSDLDISGFTNVRFDFTISFSYVKEPYSEAETDISNLTLSTLIEQTFLCDAIPRNNRAQELETTHSVDIADGDSVYGLVASFNGWNEPGTSRSVSTAHRLITY